MPTREKRLEKARRNPGGVGFDTLCLILAEHGFAIRPGRGSHYIAKLPGTPLKMTFTRKSPVKRVYVRRALDLIDDAQLRQTIQEE